MASGFGLGGQQGRCYPFWKAYQECLRTHEPQEALVTCPRVREDYYECLHHRKEYARHNAIRREVLKKQQEAANGVHGKEEADAKA